MFSEDARVNLYVCYYKEDPFPTVAWKRASVWHSLLLPGGLSLARKLIRTCKSEVTARRSCTKRRLTNFADPKMVQEFNFADIVIAGLDSGDHFDSWTVSRTLSWGLGPLFPVLQLVGGFPGGKDRTSEKEEVRKFGEKPSKELAVLLETPDQSEPFYSLCSRLECQKYPAVENWHRTQRTKSWYHQGEG